MTKYREILRLKSLGFSERNIALSCACSRNTVSNAIKKAADLKISWPLNDNQTDAVLKEMLFPKIQSEKLKRKPNYAYIRKELLRNGVSKKLLWTEYMEECRLSGEEPLMYSQFCFYIQHDEQKRRATMHVPRKPGEQVEVDWAGDPAQIIDPDTGEITKAYIFVGVMSYSQYAYVEAFINEKQKAWITAHVHMYEYFGGVSKVLVPDNCKTAVVRTKGWYSQQLNAVYHEMAQHYNTAIIPARVRKPKDKPNAEGVVGNISTWITAALRNEQFFSLSELNIAIKEKLQIFNSKLFQKKDGSRSSLFQDEELFLLIPLPTAPYEIAEWNGDRFRKWAQTIGRNTFNAIDSILKSRQIEQQAYRSCMGILKLADKYSQNRLESACEKALTFTSSPSYKSIKNILLAGRDNPQTPNKPDKSKTNKYGITRGSGYYGGKNI